MQSIAAVLLLVTCVSAQIPPPLPYAAAYDPSLQPQGNIQYLQPFGDPEGFDLQSGFEGFLVPTASGALSLLPLAKAGLAKAGFFKNFFTITKILKFVPKIALAVATVVVFFVIGAAVNFTFCAFTPLCTFKFLTRESFRSFLSEDNLTSAATFVMESVQKYKDMFERPQEDSTVDKNKL